jgi:hypothetical protein
MGWRIVKVTSKRRLQEGVFELDHYPIVEVSFVT